MARSADPMSYATVAAWVYNPGIPLGVLRPDDPAMGEIADALQVAEGSGDDIALSNARLTLGIALAHRQTAAERDRGQQLLAEVSEALQRPGYNLVELPIVNVYLAHERARMENAMRPLRVKSTLEFFPQRPILRRAALGARACV